MKNAETAFALMNYANFSDCHKRGLTSSENKYYIFVDNVAQQAVSNNVTNFEIEMKLRTVKAKVKCAR